MTYVVEVDGTVREVRWETLPAVVAAYRVREAAPHRRAELAQELLEQVAREERDRFQFLVEALVREPVHA